MVHKMEEFFFLSQLLMILTIVCQSQSIGTGSGLSPKYWWFRKHEIEAKRKVLGVGRCRRNHDIRGGCWVIFWPLLVLRPEYSGRACSVLLLLMPWSSVSSGHQQQCIEHVRWTDPCPPRALQWRHNGRDSVSNHQPHHCLLNRLFRRRSEKTSKLRVTGLCAGNSPVTGEFPAQMASNAKNVSIWWRHHGKDFLCLGQPGVEQSLKIKYMTISLKKIQHVKVHSSPDKDGKKR